MNRQEWRNARGDEGRLKWGNGPWQYEPDKVSWVDDKSGLDCLVVRGPGGALCGYVGVPEDHPMYGRDYPDVEFPGETPFPDVNGGLTFAGPCSSTEEPSEGICHVPLEGRPDNVWWLGFDCQHAYDLAPATEDYWRTPYKTYKTVGYVERDCERLAQQLASCGSA